MKRYALTTILSLLSLLCSTGTATYDTSLQRAAENVASNISYGDVVIPSRYILLQGTDYQEFVNEMIDKMKYSALHVVRDNRMGSKSVNIFSVSIMSYVSFSLSTHYPEDIDLLEFHFSLYFVSLIYSSCWQNYSPLEMAHLDEVGKDIDYLLSFAKDKYRAWEVSHEADK